ncbi:MAG: alpha/beta hydrolase [Paracoccaceae bacterium]|jgi:pimeloyl-ACP methyl ester carboxylesterase|nr:alpha/beta hydrolase [Paracoccaceae bacterium]MDH5529243.1 alpha/beta hydrolase [Paracoccaceae bacterium]
MPDDILPHRRAGAGFPLVLVHGYLGGSEQWEAEIGHFSDRFDVIAPDLPGFGAAADLPALHRIGDMADAVIALLDQLGIKRFVLLGHSMGGMIVQDMAAKLGDRISRLILYGTGPLGLMPDRFEPIELSQNRLCQDGVAKTARRIGATWFCKGEQAPGFALVAKIGALAHNQAALAGLEAMTHWDGRDALNSLTTPVLVIWGDSDKSYRWPQVEMLWKTIPKANLSVMPAAAHAAHLEKPDLFHSILDDFLAN